MPSVDLSPVAAAEIAGGLLADLPTRWAHTQGVAARARRIAPALGDDKATVEVAAWLHDIGYAPTVAETGFHPLDGARYLRATRIADPVVHDLVAHHSMAVVEAEGRGLLADLLGEFPGDAAPVLLHEAVTYCDMTTSPTGEPVSVLERTAEILDRYPSDDVVHRSIASSREELIRICGRVDALLATA